MFLQLTQLCLPGKKTSKLRKCTATDVQEVHLPRKPLLGYLKRNRNNTCVKLNKKIRKQNKKQHDCDSTTEWSQTKNQFVANENNTASEKISPFPFIT